MSIVLPKVNISNKKVGIQINQCSLPALLNYIPKPIIKNADFKKLKCDF